MSDETWHFRRSTNKQLFKKPQKRKKTSRPENQGNSSTLEKSVFNLINVSKCLPQTGSWKSLPKFLDDEGELVLQVTPVFPSFSGLQVLLGAAPDEAN